MVESPRQTRTVVTLSVGARVGATLSLLLLLVAAYLLWAPIQLYPSDGFPIMCGTAANPPADELGRAACGEVNVLRQWQSGAFAVAAVVVTLGSMYAFGVHRRQERLIATDSSADEDEPTSDE
jgi:hypothetical protein